MGPHFQVRSHGQLGAGVPRGPRRQNPCCRLLPLDWVFPFQSITPLRRPPFWRLIVTPLCRSPCLSLAHVARIHGDIPLIGRQIRTSLRNARAAFEIGYGPPARGEPDRSSVLPLTPISSVPAIESRAAWRCDRW